MDHDDYLPAGADEKCDECGRYVDRCNADPCIPTSADEDYDR